MEKLLQPEQVTATETLQPAIGFLGLGWGGKKRLQTIVRESFCTVSGIWDPDRSCIEEALQSASGTDVYNTYEDILNNREIHGTVITGPASSQAKFALEALKKGKAVFCLKLPGRNTEETRCIVQAAKDADKLLTAELPFRFNSAVRAVYEQIRSGELGHIFSAELVFHNSVPQERSWFFNPEEAEGCLMDQGIHLIDMALWALDFPVVYFTAIRMFSCGKLTASIHNTAEDFVSARLDVADNTVINISCSRNYPSGEDSVISATFYGTGGTAVVRNLDGSLYDFKAEKYTADGTELLTSFSDTWTEKPVAHWAEKLAVNEKYSAKAEELVYLAEVMDRLYRK